MSVWFVFASLVWQTQSVPIHSPTRLHPGLPRASGLCGHPFACADVEIWSKYGRNMVGQGVCVGYDSGLDPMPSVDGHLRLNARSLSEVKQPQARVVLGWVTTGEVRVLSTFSFFYTTHAGRWDALRVAMYHSFHVDLT